VTDESQQAEPERATPETKSHEPPVAPRGERGDVVAGHEPARLQEGHLAPETRGHQSPEGYLELGHPPAEGLVIVQQVGEMHQPAQEAAPPTAPPPKPADAAQSVTPPPQAQQESSPPSGGDAQNE
jgi:hypothetical protein